MLPILAQSTASLSHESMGMIGLAVMQLTRWLWDYNRQRREEEARVEPKSNPPLHERFISRPEYLADQEQIDERLRSATASRKKMHEEAEQLGNRVVALETTKEHTAAQLTIIDSKLTTLLTRLPAVKK